MEYIYTGQYCQRITDGTHDSPKYIRDGYHLVTSKFVKDGQIILNGCPQISKNDYDSINLRSKVEIGDILFTMIGTIGEVAYVKQNDFAIKNIGLFRCYTLIDSKFLLYFFMSPKGRDEIASLKTGSTQHYLTLGSLKKIKVPSKDAKERQHIVDTI